MQILFPIQTVSLSHYYEDQVFSTWHHPEEGTLCKEGDVSLCKENNVFFFHIIVMYISRSFLITSTWDTSQACWVKMVTGESM